MKMMITLMMMMIIIVICTIDAYSYMRITSATIRRQYITSMLHSNTNNMNNVEGMLLQQQLLLLLSILLTLLLTLLLLPLLLSILLTLLLPLLLSILLTLLLLLLLLLLGIPKEANNNNDFLEIITNTNDNNDDYDDDDDDNNPKGFNIPPFDKPIGGFDDKNSNKDSNLLPLTNSDMQKLGVLLADISGCFETSIISTPEEEAQLAKEGTKKALKVVTAEMKWLYRRNIPGLVQMLLQSPQGPILRQNTSIMNAYLFIIDFLEAVANESSSSLKLNQASLRALLEAAKKGEDAVDEVVKKDVQAFTNPAFFVYLDSEIDNSTGPMNQLLTTVKLRLLDEVGKQKGIDIQMIATIAAINDPIELKTKTMSYLKDYDKDGLDLFLQVLRILTSEMKKRYNKVDPGLLLNMAEIERICISYIGSKSKQ